MLVIICHPSDDAARYFFAYCERKCPGKAILVNADTLSSAKSWKLQLWNNEPSYSFCETYDGRKIESRDISAVFNRVNYFDIGNWKTAIRVERNYAEQEFYAFFLGWLYSFKDKITNLPTAQNMSGTFRHVLVWRKQALLSGINVLDYDSSQNAGTVYTGHSDRNPCQHVYIIGNTVVGYLPGMPPTRQLVSFARDQECNFLEIEFEKVHKRWKFNTATAFPVQFHTSQKCMEYLFQFFYTNS